MSTPNLSTSATTTLWIAPTLPTDYTETAFAAVTGWIKVALVSDMGQIGGTTSTVKHTDVGTGKVIVRAGSQSFGQMQVKIARHSGTDLDAIRAAFKDRAPRSFKIVYPTLIGETEYCTGIITGVPTSIGGADSMLEMTVTIDIDDEVLTVAAP